MEALLKQTQRSNKELSRELNVLVREKNEKQKKKHEERQRMKRLAQPGNFTEETEEKEYSL